MTILVTYASRSGSTIGIAEAIGETLSEKGILADVLPMSKVNDITPYQAIVAGSAIRQEKWLPEGMQFLETYAHELQQKPVATFLVCLALATENPKRYTKMLQAASTWMNPVRQLINPVTEGYFAGALDLSKISEPHFRLALGLLVTFGIWSEGDYRNWHVIRNWTETLPAQLLNETESILTH